MARGNIDTIQQTQERELSGGLAATKFITTDDSARTSGNLLMTNDDGNAVDSGIGPLSITATTHTEILTDGSGNLMFVGGDLVYVVGVPN